MGLLKNAFAIQPTRDIVPIVQTWMSGRAALPDNNYRTFATEGYSRNELVYACIEELSTSAAEPRMMIKVAGEWRIEGHPLLDLLDRPNEFMTRYQFFATVIMHRSIAGNAYALIERLNSGRPYGLWLLRPDRVKVVPDRQRYISHYEYDIGERDPIRIPPEDIIHFKARHPLDDYYGMPPLMAASARVDIDNYMRDFVKTFFQSAGVPAGLLNVKSKLSADAKTEIKGRWRNEYGGPSGWHELLILDQTEASFTPMTQTLGPSGLVVPNLDEINEARIAMCFGVPLTIIGARLGVNSSSYANKRSDRESFWEEELAPLYKDLSGALDLRLTPAFRDVQEIAFDLSDVRALQEDQDKYHARLRADVMAGLMSIEEFRQATGMPLQLEGGTFLVPANLIPTPAAALQLAEVPNRAPPQLAAPMGPE